MGPTWVLSAPDGPHVGPMNLAIMVDINSSGILIRIWHFSLKWVWLGCLQNGSHFVQVSMHLTHWGWVMHICISKLSILGSDNGLAPSWRQAIIRTNVGILLIGPLGKNFNEILIEIYTFSFKKMYLKMSSGKCRPSCLALNAFNLTARQADHPWIDGLAWVN